MTRHFHCFYIVTTTHIRYYFFLLIFFIINSVTYAQQRYATSLNHILGTNYEYIYDIKQDSNGFIWITSENGLFRFDGYQFIPYINSAMSSKAGSMIRFDQNDKLWFTNFDGEFFTVTGDSLQKCMLPQNTGISYNIDTNNNLIFVHETKLLSYNLDSKKTQELATVPQYRTIIFKNDLFQLQDAVNRRIILYNNDGTIIKNIQQQKDAFPQISIKNNIIYYPIQNANSVQIVECINEEQVIIATIPIKTSIVNMYYDDEYMVLLTKNGVIKYNYNSKTYTHTLEGIHTLNYYLDNNKNEWIGAIDGIYLFSSNYKAYKTLLPGENFSFHFLNNKYYLADIKGNIHLWNPFHKTYTNIFQSPNQQTIYTIFNSTNPNQIKNIVNTNRARDINTFQYNNEYFSALSTGIKSYIKLDEKYIATAMSGTCDVIKIGNDNVASAWDSFYNFYHHSSYIDNIAHLLINVRGKQIAFDSINKRILIASNQGLDIFTTKSHSKVQYNGKDIFSNKVLASNGTFIILNNLGKIYTIDANNNIKYIENLNNNFPINGITLFGQKLLIWNTYNIQLININELWSDNINIEYIPSPIITDQIKDIIFNDEDIFISSGNKILSIPYKYNNQDTYVPKISFEKIILNNNTIPFTNYYDIPSSIQDVAITYAIIDYNHNIYEIAYQINNGEWKNINPSDRMLNFISLKEGDYTIRFKINGKILNSNLYFTKEKPWYNEWWFYLGIMILCLTIVRHYYNYRIKNQTLANQLVLEKQQLQNDLRQSLLSSIKSQMNPHFLFNALNTIQSYIITEDKEKASKYLSMYSKLTRNILEMSDKENVSLDTEIKTINLYIELEKMRFPELEYNIKVDSSINIQHTFLPSMIIQPFVENAIKHGLLHKMDGDKKLDINIHKEDNNLIIDIMDNGIGREQSAILQKNKIKQHHSFASKANIKRVELLNINSKGIVWNYTDHKDQYGNATGTQITLKIPINLSENDTSNNSR